MLRLGTKDSYGTEYLRVLPGPEWQGLTITATFVTPAGATQALVSADGLLAVPPEATAQALSHNATGKIVFTGVGDGVQRITTDLAYTVFDHADNRGADSQPTPSVWEQFVVQVQQDATDAAASRQAAETAARQAEEAAHRAEIAGGNGAGTILVDDDSGTTYSTEWHIQNGYPVLILAERS